MPTVLIVEHGDLVHGFFVAVGVLAAAAVFFAEVRRRNAYDERLLVVVAGVLVGGAVGMRLAGVVSGVEARGLPLGDAVLFGAKSVLGGLAGAYVGALVAKRVAGYHQPTGDFFAPAIALGMAIGRWGCFLTEPLGRASALPWAVRGYHPSFSYEIAFHLVAFAVLLRLRGKLPEPGSLLLIYLCAYAVFRFVVEFTRANELLAFGFTGSQWFILAVSPLLMAKLVRIPFHAATQGARA